MTSEEDRDGLTPTERRIVDLLSDGKSHKLVELQFLLSDEQATGSTVHVHLYNIRQKLLARGKQILSVRSVESTYKLVSK